VTHSIEDDLKWMDVALDEARGAGEGGEVPVGAVAVLEGRLVATGANRTIRDCDPTAHAEMIALRAAAKSIGNYRLAGVTLYVTIEPCAMCAGAIVQARIARVVYGADDPKGGAARSCFNILDNSQLNHRVEVISNVRAEECAAQLQNFFSSRR
jgi:tRNA(adenine34) deaminase